MFDCHVDELVIFMKFNTNLFERYEKFKFLLCLIRPLWRRIAVICQITAIIIIIPFCV